MRCLLRFDWHLEKMEIDTSDLSWFKTELSAYVLAQLNSTVNPESRFLTRRKLLNEVVTGN